MASSVDSRHKHKENPQVSFRTLTSGGLPLRGGALRAWQTSALRDCFVCICLGLVVKYGDGVVGCMPRHSRNLVVCV